MGYFSNGTEGMMYEDRYCDKCVNAPDCWILLQHLMRNYEECNKPDSILHVLIPRSKDGLGNEQCVMFKRGNQREEPKLTAQEKRRLELEREYLALRGTATTG